MDFTFIKRQIRTASVQKRSEITPDYARQCSFEIIERFKSVPLPEHPVFSAYWPMKTEFDIRPLMNFLHQSGCVLCLPVVAEKKSPLLFRRWEPGAELEIGPYGTEQPNEKYPAVEPNVLLLPLLAFDRKGGRLGYGGGFYDRTLQQLRANGRPTVIGVAFAAQEIDSVPMDDNDETINYILTEHEAIEVA